jgi:hypothetical protein
MLVNDLMKTSEVERVALLEERDQFGIGEFRGSVVGEWQGYDYDGAGLVKYQGKTYRSGNEGSKSIPKGRKVQLTYANGMYVASW